jgi:hypothetical protein
MLENRVYLGEIHYGEWANTEAHEPLIDRALFEAAQIYHPPPPRTKGQGEPALLAGLVRCAACGYRMSVDSHSGIYKCRPHKATGICSAPAIVSKKRLEEYVQKTVDGYVGRARLSYQAVERVDAIAEAEAELDEVEAELAAYQQVVKVSDVGAEHFGAGMRQRVEAVEAARRQLARARLAAPALPSGLLADLGSDEKRSGLRSALGVVWVRKRRSGAGIRIIAAGFEPSEFRPIGWTDADLPGEIRPLEA